MNRFPRRLRIALDVGLLLVVVAGWVVASPVTVPNTFSNGTVADADQVNANFTALAGAINALTPANVVGVQPVGVDTTASGTALAAAVASIANASSQNPYLVRLAPGVYNIGAATLAIPPYVSLEGSGESVTTVQGNSPTAMFTLTGFSELRALGITTTGGPAVVINNGVSLPDTSTDPFLDRKTGLSHVLVNGFGVTGQAIVQVIDSPAHVVDSVIVSGGGAGSIAVDVLATASTSSQFLFDRSVAGAKATLGDGSIALRTTGTNQDTVIQASVLNADIGLMASGANDTFTSMQSSRIRALTIGIRVSRPTLEVSASRIETDDATGVVLDVLGNNNDVVIANTEMRGFTTWRTQGTGNNVFCPGAHTGLGTMRALTTQDAVCPQQITPPP